MNKFHIGDRVAVVDNGYAYDTMQWVLPTLLKEATKNGEEDLANKMILDMQLMKFNTIPINYKYYYVDNYLIADSDIYYVIRKYTADWTTDEVYIVSEKALSDKVGITRREFDTYITKAKGGLMSFENALRKVDSEAVDNSVTFDALSGIIDDLENEFSDLIIQQ